MHIKKLSSERVRLDEIVQAGSSVSDHLNVNAPLFPNNVRALIVGESACGKTHATISLLLSEHGLKFEHVLIVSPTACQDKYKLLEDVLRGTGVTFNVHMDIDEVSMDSLKPFTTIVFDDLTLSDYTKVSPFFYRGRHAVVNCLFLTHTYGVHPPQIIKQNANAIFFYKLPLNTLKLIHRDFVGSDMTWDEFLSLCKLCFHVKHNFVSIVKDFPINSGRYRKNFDQFVTI